MVAGTRGRLVTSEGADEGARPLVGVWAAVGAQVSGVGSSYMILKVNVIVHPVVLIPPGPHAGGTSMELICAS